MRILLCYNGSETSKAALIGVRKTGLAEKDAVIVIYVTDVCSSSRQDEEAKVLVESAAAELRHGFPGSEVVGRTAVGSVADEIVAAASAFDIDMIVIGGRVDRVVNSPSTLGKNAQRILSEAECTVRIVRAPDRASDDAERLLVAFDGSVGSVNAVNCIVERRWNTPAIVRLLAVADSSVLGSIGRFMPQMRDVAVKEQFAEQWAETLASASLSRLRTAGIECSVCVRFGDPRAEIIREAADWNADTIFLGPHARSGSAERLLMGSVSTAVATGAHCSVEIVRS